MMRKEGSIAAMYQIIFLDNAKLLFVSNGINSLNTPENLLKMNIVLRFRHTARTESITNTR